MQWAAQYEFLFVSLHSMVTVLTRGRDHLNISLLLCVCLCACKCVFVSVCMSLWLGMCFHASEKLLSDTAVPLFSSHSPFLAKLPLAARSHDPPRVLLAFTFSLACLVSEKQKPAPSPTLDSSIVYWLQPSEYISKAMASFRKPNSKSSRNNCSQEKRSACFFLSVVLLLINRHRKMVPFCLVRWLQNVFICICIDGNTTFT